MNSPQETMEPTKPIKPEELMGHFEGRSLKSIIIFTVVIHAVIILGTSVPFLIESFTGPDTEKLSEEERTQLAVKEATTHLRKIAEEHGIRPQELSEQIGGSRPRAAEAAEPQEVAAEISPEPETPKSEYEKNLEKVEEGPTVPPVDTTDNLFE